MSRAAFDNAAGPCSAARMRPAIRLAAMFSTVLSGALAAGGPPSRVGRIDVTCPVCTRAFKAFAVVLANTYAGVDRDLFARAIGPQPEFYRVSTCPGCGYSGYLEDFRPGMVLSPAFVRHVLDSPRLRPDPPIAENADQADIPPQQRYELAIQCYEWLNRSDEARAWLHLRTAWVTRDAAAILPPEPMIAQTLRELESWLPPHRQGENQADRELVLATRLAARLAEGYFDDTRAPAAHAVLAMLLRRHGENVQARPLLETLVADERVGESVRAACRRMLDSIAVEMRHQRQAAESLRRALFVEQVSESNRPAALYLLGELYRRLGDRREADVWFRKALSEKALPPDLRAWTGEQLEAPAGSLAPGAPH